MDDNNLLSDDALSDPNEDLLGYEEFATDLAHLIEKDVPKKGFVVSVNGQWGSGKSTILNFLEAELSDGDESPKIVRFNPWWFSGEADLIQRYLEELALALDEADQHSWLPERLATAVNRAEQHSELREELAGYAKVISKAPVDPAVSTAASAAGRFFQPEETTTNELKSSVESTIKDKYDHIVVFIDEIDRLTNRETSQVFKLVKSVADFPHTTFVLAFSRDIVTDALEADENPHRVEDGDEFLDKIVQLPRRVPVPKRGSLRMMLEQGLQEIVPQDTTGGDDRNSNIITEISKLVDTPRDVTRLLNSVQSSYKVLDEEINFLDIVALEALKEHAEPVYKAICREPDSFAVLVKVELTSGSTDEATLDENVSQPVENLLSDIFPHWQKGEWVMSDEIEFSYRESNRVAHPDHLHRYFRKTVPESQYSSTELAAIMRSTDDVETFTSKLREELLAADSEPIDNRILLSELVASRNKIRDMGVLLQGIFNIADDLIQLDDRPSTMFETNTTTYLLYLYRFASNNQKTEPTSNIKTAMKDGESVFFPWYVWNQEGAAGSDSDIRYCSYTPDLENIMEIIWDLASQKKRDHKLADVPHPWHVVKMLYEDDEQFVTDWLDGVVADETRLLRLLVGFTRPGRINGQPVYYIDVTELEEYVDLDTVEATVSSLAPVEHDNREQRAIEKFEKAMELLEEGKDPGKLENWAPTI